MLVVFSFFKLFLERFSNECGKLFRDCFGFAFLHSLIGLKNSRHFFNQWKADQNQSWPGRTHFPAQGAAVTSIGFYLIGSLYCLRQLWLARVITLVLVTRHSNANRSIVRRNQPRPHGTEKTMGTKLRPKQSWYILLTLSPNPSLGWTEVMAYIGILRFGTETNLRDLEEISFRRKCYVVSFVHNQCVLKI